MIYGFGQTQTLDIDIKLCFYAKPIFLLLFSVCFRFSEMGSLGNLTLISGFHSMEEKIVGGRISHVCY